MVQKSFEDRVARLQADPSHVRVMRTTHREMSAFIDEPDGFAARPGRLGLFVIAMLGLVIGFGASLGARPILNGGIVWEAVHQAPVTLAVLVAHAALLGGALRLVAKRVRAPRLTLVLLAAVLGYGIACVGLVLNLL